VDRVTLYHRTLLVNLPLIELEGLRTRIDLSDRLGPVGDFDAAATGRHARGRRVSGWTSRSHAQALVGELGPGLVSYTVDPRKAVANRAADRAKDPSAVWDSVRPLTAWLEDAGGDVAGLPDDLEVHQEQPVRAKLVRMHAPDLSADELGVHAGVVAAVADEDRVAAKLLMHLALAAADGDADGPAFRAACALAWRDEPDGRDIMLQVGRADAEAVLEVVLADLEDRAPDGAAVLLGVLDVLRSEAAGGGGALGQLMMERSERSLADIVAVRAVRG
jgi:hypothetical protein